MNDQPLVSIIIPVYKVEAYLDECVRSVMNQTYQNLEIILVDDGSPDRCGEMCDDYAGEDNRIKVIHKPNGGLSDARNVGMTEAVGEYLFFLDSDDFIRSDAIELLVRQIQQSGADIVCSAPLSFLDGTVPGEERSSQISSVCYDTESAMVHFAQCDWGAWGKLYRREIHQSIFFPVGRIHEDEAIMLDLLERCTKVCDITEKIYYYRQRTNSITSTGYSLKKMDWFYGWERNVSITVKRHEKAFDTCLAKAWTVALYNIGNLYKMENTSKELEKLFAFMERYKTDILKCRYISSSCKLRLIILLLSNKKKRPCLYTMLYGIRARIRK